MPEGDLIIRQTTADPLTQCTCVFKRLGSLNAHISRFHPEAEETVVEGAVEAEVAVEGVEAEVGVEHTADLLSRAIQSAIAGASAALGQPSGQVGGGSW